MHQYLLFLITNIAAQFYAGTIPAYGVVKHEMNEEFGLGEQFMGILQLLIFVFQVLAIGVFVLTSTHEPKKTYFLACCFQCLGLALVVVSSFFPSMTKLILVAGIIIMGAARCCYYFPYILLIEHINAEEKKATLNIWLGIYKFGNALGYLIMGLLMHRLGLSWKLSLMIWMLIFFISSLVLEALVDQVKISHENEEEATFTQQLKETTSYLKEFLSVPYNFVLSMDCMLIVSFHYNLLLWLPYYLEKTGHGADSSTIAFMYPLALVASPFLLEYFVSFCPNQVKYFTDTMLICNVVVFFILNAQKEQQTNIFFMYVMFAIVGLMIGAPMSRVTGSQLNVLANNKKERYILVNFCLLLGQSLAAILLFFIGFFMERNVNSFFIIFLIDTIMIAIVHSIRRVMESWKTNIEDDSPEKMIIE